MSHYSARDTERILCGFALHNVLTAETPSVNRTEVRK